MKRFLVAFVASLIGLAVVGVAPASAHGSEDVIHIKALAGPGFTSGPGTACPETSALGASVMSGNLVGCWYGDLGAPSTPPLDNHNGTYTQSFVGTEHFVGCIDTDRDGVCRDNDPSGTWKTTFVFTGTFLWATGAEVSGGCTHPIVSGTGDFQGAKGTIFMTDNVNDGTSNVFGWVSVREDVRED